MRGEPFHFAREDYVEEAWRIVDPVLKAPTPVFEYEPGTWGPPEAAALVAPGERHVPVTDDDRPANATDRPPDGAARKPAR